MAIATAVFQADEFPNVIVPAVPVQYSNADGFANSTHWRVVV
jgi:hypothetical protein